LQPFVISVGGLKPGTSRYEWLAGDEFFKSFENSEVLYADLQVCAELSYSGYTATLKCSVNGSVTVVCDRCLEDLELPVETEFELGADEIDLSNDIDLRQDIYDYVCTSLPMQKVHPDGDCNSETIKYLGK